MNCESPSVREWNKIETLRVTDIEHFALTRLFSMDWPGAQDSPGAQEIYKTMSVVGGRLEKSSLYIAPSGGAFSSK